MEHINEEISRLRRTIAVKDHDISALIAHHDRVDGKLKGENKHLKDSIRALQCAINRAACVLGKSYISPQNAFDAVEVATVKKLLEVHASLDVNSDFCAVPAGLTPFVIEATMRAAMEYSEMK